MSGKGQLYFIRAANTRRVKVGFTRGPVEARLGQLQIGSSIPLQIEQVFEVAEPEYAEALVHKDLQLYRVHGEWFELDREDLEAYIGAFEESRLPDLAQSNNS